jgi:hypothetical protein
VPGCAASTGKVQAVAHRAVATIVVALFVVGLSPSASFASATPRPKAARAPVVWLLTIQDRLERIQAGTKPTIYDNPLHCDRGEDDCNLQGIAAARGALWVPDSTNGLRAIDPATGKAANASNHDRYSSPPVVWDQRLWFTDVDRFLGVAPPSTQAAVTGTIAGAYVEDLAASPHFLWAVGSGSSRDGPAVIARLDASGDVTKRFTVPISGELSPVIAAVNDQTAYAALTPEDGNAPSQLFRFTVSASGTTRVDNLGALTFNPGGIVPIDGNLWLNDINAQRLVELNPGGQPIGQASLDTPGDGQLLGASGRLWYLGAFVPGSSALQVIDPDTGAVESTTQLTLPKDDRGSSFTVVG